MAEQEKPAEQQQGPSLEDLQARVEELTQTNQKFAKKNEEYERILLDPNYLEYVASGGARAREKPQAKAEEVDFDSMSNKDLAEYLLRSVQGYINQTVQPLHQKSEVDAAVTDIKETAAKHEDYWVYKDEMLKIANRVNG